MTTESNPIAILSLVLAIVAAMLLPAGMWEQLRYTWQSASAFAARGRPRQSR
jgi:hypothetical protein